MTTDEGDAGKRWQQDQVNRVGRAIRELRGQRSSQWVSDRTEELGHRIGRTTITDMEIGRRKYVAWHELSMIAAALGVTPAQLVTHGDMPRGMVEFLPGREARGDTAVRWCGGELVPSVIPPGRGLDVHPATAIMALSRRLSELDRLLLTAVSSQLGTSPASTALLRDLRAERDTVIAQLGELGGNLGDGEG